MAWVKNEPADHQIFFICETRTKASESDSKKKERPLSDSLSTCLLHVAIRRHNANAYARAPPAGTRPNALQVPSVNLLALVYTLCDDVNCKKCAHVDVQSRSTAEEPKELGGPGLVDAATDVVQPAVDRQGIHWLGDALEGRRRSVEIPPLCIYLRT